MTRYKVTRLAKGDVIEFVEILAAIVAIGVFFLTIEYIVNKAIFLL